MGWFSGRRVILWPIFGAAIGACGAIVYLGGNVLGAAVPPSPIRSLNVGLAIFWGALAFVPRERLRFGIVDVILMAATSTIRWILIESLAPVHALPVFIAAQTVPRAAEIALAWLSRPAPAGVGYEFLRKLESWAAVIVIAEGIVAAMWLGWRPGLTIIAGSYVIARVVQWFAYRYRGGVNANSLGAMQSLTEFMILLLFDCSACRW